MVELALALLAIFWLLGIVNIPWLKIPHTTLFLFNQQPITIRDFVIAFIVIWVVSLLPKPFRLIVGILFILWLLSVFGIVTISGFSNLLILAVIISLFLYLFGFTK